MREVRMALLEADVNYVVVKDFIKRVSERCIGTEILSSLNAGQQVIKIVNEELTALMAAATPNLPGRPRCLLFICCAACRALVKPPGAASWPITW